MSPLLLFFKSIVPTSIFLCVKISVSGVEKGIDWESPEPTDENLYNDLLTKGFSKDQIFAWDVFQILPQYNQQMKRGGFEKYVSGFIDRFKRTTSWDGFDYSYERAVKLGKQIFGEAVDVENDPNALDRIDPIPWDEKKKTDNSKSHWRGLFTF